MSGQLNRSLTVLVGFILFSGIQSLPTCAILYECNIMKEAV